MATRFNESHVVFDGHYFNSSLLREFNYTIYENGTLSNSSHHCYLVFDKFDVVLLPNGTAINGTKCESTIYTIGKRGSLGLAFGVMFGLLIVLGITALNKHGRNHLPLEKRWRLVSRRWPWYWYLVAATCGCISGFTGVDIDRNYLQGTSLILQNVFYYVTLPAMLGAIWEMTRHWGSLCERILLDEDAWRFPHEDTRTKLEFYFPLVFYLFAFLTFFLSVLRSWTWISRGTWSVDLLHISISNATDGRFKASSLFGFFAWLVILASIATSVTYYQPTARRVPLKIPICMAAILVRIVYNIAVAWEYDIGPLGPWTPDGYIWALGYAPIVFCMIVMCIWAKIEMNDDLKIKMLRRERERRLDTELGITRGLKGTKPGRDDDSVF